MYFSHILMKSTSFLTQQISQKTPVLGVVVKCNLVLCKGGAGYPPVVVWGEVKGLDPKPQIPLPGSSQAMEIWLPPG